MKLLINGYTVGEHMELKRNISKYEITKINKMIGHLKRNKKKYLMLVIAIAVTIDLSGLTLINVTVVSTGLEGTLANKFTEIVDKLIFLAKYACMGMGLKDMIICMLNGGNMKEASFAGVQYWLGYLFLQFYPTLFN